MSALRSLVVLCTLIVGCSCQDLITWSYCGEDHYNLGLSYGQKFTDEIQARLGNSSILQDQLLPFYNTPAGKKVYDAFVDINNKTYPGYFQELVGIADGSGVPFHYVFLQNLQEEFSNFVSPNRRRDYVEHCSDYMLRTDKLALNGHNEDGGDNDLNHMMLATVSFGMEAKFVAYTYMGDLSTGAFGFNLNGIAFSMNYVHPTEGVVGLGRVFMARDLLWAENLDDALKRITRDGMAAGHNYQLMDVCKRRILNVEVGPHGQHSVKEIKAGDKPFFHANMYKTLNISQTENASSVHREARVAELPLPTSADDILNILGDQFDAAYPIFHDQISHDAGDVGGGWTLITAMFDLNAETVTLYSGNPIARNVLTALHINGCD